VAAGRNSGRLARPDQLTPTNLSHTDRNAATHFEWVTGSSPCSSPPPCAMATQGHALWSAHKKNRADSSESAPALLLFRLGRPFRRESARPFHPQRVRNEVLAGAMSLADAECVGSATLARPPVPKFVCHCCAVRQVECLRKQLQVHAFPRT